MILFSAVSTSNPASLRNSSGMVCPINCFEIVFTTGAGDSFDAVGNYRYSVIIIENYSKK